MQKNSEREFLLIGISVYLAQKIEFAMYGIVAHLGDEIKNEVGKPFSDLTPENFLRGDTSKLKATLGLINKKFGGILFQGSEEITQFIEDRNLIGHNYFRHFQTEFSSSGPNTTALNFLEDFIERGQKIFAAIQGLLFLLAQALAKKNGVENKINFGLDSEANADAYLNIIIPKLNAYPSLQEYIDAVVKKKK